MQLGDESTSVTLFEQQPIRRAWHDSRWFYSVIDVIAALTDSGNPRVYWAKLKERMAGQDEGFVELIIKCSQLKLIALDGKLRETDCADVETLFAIIDAIPASHRRQHKNHAGFPCKSGVYAIVNIVTEEQYIGSSFDVSGRFTQHRSELRRGRHYSSALQAAWNQQGEEAFLFVLIEEVSDITGLEIAEQFYLDTENHAYNVARTATNAATFAPINEAKKRQLKALLGENARLPTERIFFQDLHLAIHYGILIPGPDYNLASEAGGNGVRTWQEFEDYLRFTKKVTHE